jgi:PE family
MSYVLAAPELMTAAAGDLGNIGAALTEEHVAAAALTVGLVPAAGDEVSAGVAHLFSQYAEGFQGLAGRAAAFPEQFAHTLTAGAHSYASAEAVNVSYLRWLVENAGLYAATRALFEMLRSNTIFFQLLQYVLEPIRAVLGLSLLLLFLVGVWVVQLLSSFLGKVGL